MLKKIAFIIMGIPVKGMLGKINEHLFKEKAKSIRCSTIRRWELI